MSGQLNVETPSKKIINDPSDVVDEALDGVVLSNKNVQLLQGHRVLIRRDIRCVRERGFVALVSGGGSGHEPAHGGFVGNLVYTMHFWQTAGLVKLTCGSFLEKYSVSA